MNITTVVIIGIAYLVTWVVIALGVAIWLHRRQRRTEDLRAKFGPEYTRMARAQGDVARAEDLLARREKRVRKLDITPLTASQRNEFANEWERTQGEFVDDPEASIIRADALVQEVMKVRGYPVVDFDQRVADVSVDHPAVAQNYRLAHQIAEQNEREDIGLEKLREAMLHYRALFADLLHDGGLSPIRQIRPEERERTRRVA